VTFWEKMNAMDPRWIFLGMAVLLTIPVLFPLGLAITIDQETTVPIYNWIENLNPGDIVFADVSYSGGSAGELGPQHKAWFRHCMLKGVKVVWVAQWNTGAQLGYKFCLEVVEDLAEEGIEVEYGVDWVYVGWKAGGTTMWRNMQLDFWDACAKEDWVGNSFEDLPLMQRVKKWDKETCKGIMLFTAGSPGVPTYTTYFHDYDIYLGNVAVQVPGNMNLLRAGQIKGMLCGLPGAAQYEILLDRPGQAVKLMDAQSLGHLWIIVLVILGNIGFYITRKSGTPSG